MLKLKDQSSSPRKAEKELKAKEFNPGASRQVSGGSSKLLERPKEAPRRPQETPRRPKLAQDRPKHPPSGRGPLRMPPRSARMPPRRPKEGPGGGPGAPRWPQDCHKMVPDGPRRAQDEARMALYRISSWKLRPRTPTKKNLQQPKEITIFEGYGTSRMAQDGAKSGPRWAKVGQVGA